jgi:hypothetical protein
MKMSNLKRGRKAEVRKYIEENVQSAYNALKGVNKGEI